MKWNNGAERTEKTPEFIKNMVKGIEQRFYETKDITSINSLSGCSALRNWKTLHPGVYELTHLEGQRIIYRGQK